MNNTRSKGPAPNIFLPNNASSRRRSHNIPHPPDIIPDIIMQAPFDYNQISPDCRLQAVSLSGIAVSLPDVMLAMSLATMMPDKDAAFNAFMNAQALIDPPTAFP